MMNDSPLLAALTEADLPVGDVAADVFRGDRDSDDYRTLIRNIMHCGLGDLDPEDEDIRGLWVSLRRLGLPDVHEAQLEWYRWHSAREVNRAAS